MLMMLMRMPKTGLLLAVLSLVLVVAPPLAAASGPPPGDGPWVVRAAFTERDQVNRLAASTDTKTGVVQRLVELHRGEPTLVIGQYLDQLDDLA